MRPRGTGAVFRSKWKDKKTGELKESRFWSIRYFVSGKMFNESSGSERRRDAERLLSDRLNELRKGNPDPSASAKTTLEDLARLVVDDYIIKERKSTVRLKRSLGHLRRFFFDNRLASSITPASVIEYTSQRKSSGAANATINRELAALKRAFHLGRKSSLVMHIPSIKLLVERNRRTGFFEHDEFRAVLTGLPTEIKPIVTVAYLTGWRVHSEVLTRQWRHIDFRWRQMRLDADETKNGEPRVFPFLPELEETLVAQRDRTAALERALEMRIPWVFHRNGKQIKSFRGAWKQACEQAGIPGRFPHDFRRTAVRNLERAGVSRSVAMAMVGHETESIYKRYAIVDETALSEGAAKLTAHHEAERKPGKVIPYEKRTRRGKR
jgi:integrase